MQAVTNPEGTFHATKRLIGRSFDDDETKKEYTIATQKAKDRQLIREKEKLTSYEGPYKEQSYNAAQNG